MRIISKAAFLSLAIIIFCFLGAIIAEILFGSFSPRGYGRMFMFGGRLIFILFCVGIFVLLTPVSEFFNKIYSKYRVIIFIFAMFYIISGLIICLYEQNYGRVPYRGGYYPAIFFLLSLILSIPLANLSTFLFADYFIRPSGAHYAMAEKEINDNNIDSGVWAKAFVKANGNEERRKALYVKLRAKELTKNEYK